MADAKAPERMGAEGPSPARTPRADAIFIAALAIIALLIVALMAAFASQRGLHARTVETIAVARNVRDDVQAISQALADVEAARRAASIARTGADATLANAKETTLTHVGALQRHVAVDERIAAAAARIRSLIEEEFALDASPLPPARLLPRSAALRADLRAATDELLDGVNAFNDAARENERRMRERLDFIAIALGLLSLAVVGLAVISLRRERERWRVAHDAAEEARASAIAADRAKSRFLAVASHDMRQPLHALTLYLSALERRVESDEARDIIAKMDRATQSMVGMFSMLLDLARVQAGVVMPEFVEAPLQEVLDRVVAGHAGGRVEAFATDLVVRTDPHLLERILSNLVVNALKHGGGAARLSAWTENGAAVVEVADDGPGIPLADQQRIFEEFVRLEGPADGLGLGLAIVKRVAELLEAPLVLHSAPGKGARFQLRLPLAAGSAVRPRVVSGWGDLRGVRVLVMDDDALAREVMAAALRDRGAEVRICADADGVAATLDEGFAPRLLLLDLRIKGELRGLAVADAASARLGPAARAIIITGDTAPEALAALRASGHAWLVKPVSPRDLETAIAAQLQSSST